VQKYCKARQVTDDDMDHAHYMFDTYGYKRTLKHIILFAFLLHQWLHERTSMLHYMYIACLVLF